MKIKIRKKIYPILVAVILLLLLIMSYVGLDPDLSWRLRTGFYIIKNGIPATDIYSYTMPSFPWVDHAWLTDLGLSYFYSVVGKIGLAIIFSSLAYMSLYIASKRVVWENSINKANDTLFLKPKWSIFVNPVFLLSVASVISFFGVRVQVVTWFMLSVFLSILFNRVYWNKWKIYIPLFFILWANLHGGFAEGLVTFVLVLVTRTIKDRKINNGDWLILIASLLGSLINPYGTGVWREVWSSVSDNNLRWSIAEWRPLFMSLNLPILSLIALSSLFVYRYRKLFKIEEVVVFSIYLLEAVSSSRNVPIWVIAALPMTMKSLSLFYDEVSGNKISKLHFKIVYKFLWYGVIGLITIQFALSIKSSSSISERNFYPVDAIKYLKQNLPEGRIFSDYGWGGYLILKLPEKKVFIDGRMPSWRWNANLANETNYVMKDYEDILTGYADYKKIFAKYNVTTVLLPKRDDKDFFTPLDNVLGNRFSSLKRLLGIREIKRSFLESIKSDGWTVVYEDNLSTIYTVPSNFYKQ